MPRWRLFWFCIALTLDWNIRNIMIWICLWHMALYVNGIQKILQFNMRQKWHKQNFYFIFQHNGPFNSNMYVTSVKKLFYASQIEFWSYALQIRLSTQWPVWSHCHLGTSSSDDNMGRSHWVGVSAIPIPCSLLQHAEQEQGSTMIIRSSRPLSRTWRACNKNSIWLASKSCLINVTCIAVKGDYVE